DLRAGAGPGNDTMFGEDGDDILRGGLGDVAAFGGSGADRIQTYGGVDFIDPGGVGPGNPGVDQVLAGAGDDFIRVADDGNASINGEEGDDSVTQVANGSQAITNRLLLG